MEREYRARVIHDGGDLERFEELKKLLGIHLQEEGEAEVLILMVGEESWRSAALDQALAAALSEGLALCPLLLPSYDYPGLRRRQAWADVDLRMTLPRDGRYWIHSIPERLAPLLSLELPMRPWPEQSAILDAWIEEAQRKTPRAPELPLIERDHPQELLGWGDPVGGSVSSAKVIFQQ